MNPLKYAQMMKYLTRAKKTNPDLPDVFPASKAPIPAKTKIVEEMEAVNRFVRANPRTEKAGGGMLVQPGFGGTRQGYKEDGRLVKSKKRLKQLNEETALYTDGRYKTYDSLPDDRKLKQTIGKRATLRAQGKNIGAGKGSPGKPRPVGEDFVSPMKDARIAAKVAETQKLKFQESEFGKRIQWIADNGKNYSDPEKFKKAYEKHFKHKIGSKKDALFNFDEGAPGLKKGTNNIKLINYRQVDNMTFPGSKSVQPLSTITKNFSEDELFKASIIQNNPDVQKQFKELFEQVHNNVSELSELGPESLTERLNKGQLFQDFDFIKSTVIGNREIGGVHSGIVRASLLKVAGVNPEHLTSFQSVRKPIMAISKIIQNLKNPSFAKSFGISPATATKIRGQLENFLDGEKNLIADIKKINNQLGDVKFNNIFGGVNFEHTLAKQFGKDYKYLPRNYLLKGQFTTRAFNMFKKDAFDLPLIRLMKQYEQGKVSGAQVQKFIDDFNAKTNNYADFNFDINKGRLAYSDNAVKYDLSRYADPNVARQELIKNIDLTMSPEFQKGFKNLPEARDQLKLFRSKEAKNVRSLLAKIGCPGKIAKAYGGRIQFQEGLSTEFCMAEGAKVIKEKRIDSPAQKANYNKMMKVATVGKNMALLKDVLGPYGLGGDVLLEGMIAVNKTLTGGTPFKESWQDSWLSSIVGGEYDEAGQKLGRQKLFELRSGLSSGAQEFGDYNRKVEEYYKLIEQRNNLEALSGGSDFDYVGDLSSDVRQINNKIKVAERELGRMETRINAQGGFEAAENEYNRKTAERQDADAATSLQSIGRQFVDENQLNQMLRDDFSALSSDALPMQKEPRPVLPNYETFKPDIPTLSTYKSMYEEAGVTPPDDKVLEQDLNQERFRQLFEQPGFMGASDTFFGDTIKMAGGGIAKLAGVSSGPPPESGPNPQGLQGLMKRVRNL